MSHHKQDLRAIFIYDNAMQANYDAQIPVRPKQKVVKTIRSNKYSLKAKLDFTFPIKVSANGSIHEHIGCLLILCLLCWFCMENVETLLHIFMGGGVLIQILSCIILLLKRYVLTSEPGTNNFAIRRRNQFSLSARWT